MIKPFRIDLEVACDVCFKHFRRPSLAIGFSRTTRGKLLFFFSFVWFVVNVTTFEYSVFYFLNFIFRLRGISQHLSGKSGFREFEKKKRRPIVCVFLLRVREWSFSFLFFGLVVTEISKSRVCIWSVRDFLLFRIQLSFVYFFSLNVVGVFFFFLLSPSLS